MASPSARQSPRPFDLSVVLESAPWRDNRLFVEMAIERGWFVHCENQQCRRVLGVGFDKELAKADVIENGTGAYDEKIGWRCNDHAKVAK